MSDDFKPPKGPILPDPKDPKRVDDGKRTNIIDIKETLKERNEKRQQKKQAKTKSHQKDKPEKEKKKKSVKTTVEAETGESYEVDPVKKKQKETREKFNDKKRIERLRSKVEGWLVRFATEVLPKRNPSAGNNPTRAPVHPLTSKMTGRDPNVSADTTQQPDAAQQLQNVLAHKKELANQKKNQNNFTPPTPKPPGG